MGKLRYKCSVHLKNDEVTVTTKMKEGGTWQPLGPDEKIVLYHGDSIRVEVGDGWEKDAYVWRLHPYAPNDAGQGPRYSSGEGVWQCDCASDKGVDNPLLSKLYHVTPAPPIKPSKTARPTVVTLRNDQHLELGEVGSHWLTGRIAWGTKPDDPCHHADDAKQRLNKPFDPEMENRSGSPPTCQIRIFRRNRARSRRVSR